MKDSVGRRDRVLELICWLVLAVILFLLLVVDPIQVASRDLLALYRAEIQAGSLIRDLLIVGLWLVFACAAIGIGFRFHRTSSKSDHSTWAHINIAVGVAGALALTSFVPFFYVGLSLISQAEISGIDLQDAPRLSTLAVLILVSPVMVLLAGSSALIRKLRRGVSGVAKG